MEPEWLTLIRLRLKALLKRRQLDRDLQEELTFHLAMREHKYLKAGLHPAEADTQARRQFGNTERIQEICRDLWTFTSLEILLQDLRYAIRALATSRGFTAVAVLSLALGIAVNSTIFSVINAVQFRPLPYRDPDRLMVIFETRAERVLDFTGQPAVANVMDWRKQNHVFEDIAVTAPYSGAQTLTGLGPAERVRTQDGSPNLFPLLGVPPVLGRGFDMREARKGNRQFVLSSV